MTAFKKAETSEDYIIRLFEPAGKESEEILSLPAFGIIYKVKLNPFEIKTLRLDRRMLTITEVGLMEV